MLKRDFYLNHYFIYLIVAFIPLVYLMNGDPVYLYSGAMLGFLYNTFYYDNKNHVNRFVVSLPLKKQQIVLSRYLFFLCVIVGVLFYQWLVDILAHYGLPYLSAEPMTLKAVGLIFLSVGIAVAIVLPLYYSIQSYIKATIISFTLLFVGAFSLGTISASTNLFQSVVYTVNRMPVLMPVIQLICFYASFRLSTWIYIKKDVKQ